MTNKNETPLHIAIVYGKDKVVQKLLARGCNVNVKTTDKETPLHLALKFGMSYDRDEGFRLLSLLLPHGADVNAQDNDGDTPLEWALIGDSSMTLDSVKVIAFQQHNSNM